LTIGTVERGENASASITGISPNQTLNLVLPKGDNGPAGQAGPANSLTIGNVQGGDVAQASITGTSPNQTLNLILPKGDKGDPGDNFVSVLTGTQENPIYLGDLDRGIYILNGYIDDREGSTYHADWGNDNYATVSIPDNNSKYVELSLGYTLEYKPRIDGNPQSGWIYNDYIEPITTKNMSDFAAEEELGFIKEGSNLWFPNDDGVPACNPMTYSQYLEDLGSYGQSFVGTVTLQNVLNAKIGDIQTLLDNLDIGEGV
jgi:hypothetical protein